MDQQTALFALAEWVRRRGEHAPVADVALLLLAWQSQSDPSVRLIDGQNSLYEFVKKTTALDRVFGWTRHLSAEEVAAAALMARTINVSDLTLGRGLAALPVALGAPDALPTSLVTVIASLCEVAPGESVYVAWDQYGQVAAELSASGAVVTSEGVGHYRSLLLSIVGDNAWKTVEGNPMDAESTREYDASVGLVPMGVRPISVSTRGRTSHALEPPASFPVQALRLLLSRARGRVVATVQNTLLFSPGAEKMFRNELVAQHMLRAVVGMPARTLVGSQVAFSVLVLDAHGANSRVRFVNADSPSFRKGKQRKDLIDADELAQAVLLEHVGSDACATVPVNAILENEAQLLATRYVLTSAERRASLSLAQDTATRLDEICVLVRPPAKQREDQTLQSAQHTGVFTEIGVSDFPPYGYLHSGSRQVELPAGTKVEDVVLRQNDILMTVKGSVGKVALVPLLEPTQKWIPSQASIVIRMQKHSPVDARALFMFLRSELGQLLIRRIASGATAPQIQLSELKKLQVAVPSAEEQRRAVEILDAEEAIERMIRTGREQQASLASHLWSLQSGPEPN